ncbi:MAG: glycosyltransferase family 4 protein [Candidatus Kapabacteria bacterium]|nr:glycosyltransferase family 4 protein [Candidatus Kapabacteria bacterium]MDW8012304.1 glycosyltransferase family 4 protein [Bacteroidota bacterium]
MKRVLMAVPTPPPYAGPEVGMELVLRHWRSERLALMHVRTTLRESNAEKGRFDWKGIAKFVRVWREYITALWRWRPHLVFLLLSSSWVGIVRDIVLIVTARLWGARVVAQYRGGNFAGFFALQPPLRRSVIRWGLRQLQGVFVQSDGLRQQFEGLVPAEQIRVLVNGVQLEGLPRRRRVVAEAPPYRLLFVGHIAFAKGVRELLRAYRQLRDAVPVELWLIGTRIADPEVAASFLPPEWQQYYRKHSAEIEAEIDHYLKQQEQYGIRISGVLPASAVRQAMVEADVFVLPSYSEGFSMALLEAMAAGLPVVVTAVGALTELVTDGIHGRVVPPGDTAALASALLQSLQEPGWLRLAGARNRQRVATDFAIENVVQRWEEELYWVLERS